MESVETKKRGRPKKQVETDSGFKIIEAQHRGNKIYRMKIAFKETDSTVEISHVEVVVGTKPFDLAQMVSNVGAQRVRNTIQKAVAREIKDKFKSFFFSAQSPLCLG